MRHRIADNRFNRDTNERKALLTGLLRNLTEKGEIVTTRAKAKALKRLADKMVFQALDNSLASRRLLHRTFGKRDVVNTLVERVAPAMKDRVGGYTRVVDLGNRRGDNTPMAKISFVTKAEKVGDLKSGKEYKKEVKAKVAPKAKVAKEEKVAVKAPAKATEKTVKVAAKKVEKKK